MDLSRVNWYSPSKKETLALAQSREFIPDDVFPIVQGNAYTPTSDLLITAEIDKVMKFLLVERAENPWKGKLFLPGGQYRATGAHHSDDSDIIEPSRLGAVRIVKRELDLDIDPARLEYRGEYECLNPESRVSRRPYYTNMHLYRVHLRTDEVSKIRLDKTGHKYEWFEKVEDHFEEIIKRILRRKFGIE